MLGLLLVLAAAPAGAAAAPGGAVHVVQIDGALDRITASFLRERIDSAPRDGAQVVIVTVNSGVSLGVDPAPLVNAVRSSPVPVAVWVGGRATAGGAAREVVAAADFVARAPDARIDPPVEVQLEAPAVGDVVIGLDGRTIKGTALHTATLVTVEGGRSALQPSVTVRFYKPDFFARLLHATTSPNIALFLLLAGLTALAFEFFTAGIGMAALAGAGCLTLSLSGLVALPTRWVGVVVVLLGFVLLGIDAQSGRLFFPTALGTAIVCAGSYVAFSGLPSGLRLTAWLFGLEMALLVFFWAIAMRVMVRTRYATAEVRRDGLIDEEGTAVTELAPRGVVMLRGASWGARAGDATLVAGDLVKVTGTDGIVVIVRRV